MRSFVRTQQVRAKSSGEAEFYGLVDTTQEIILLQSVLKFAGFDLPAEVGTDSSAAKALSERMGVGPRVRHLETSSLWMQDCVRDRHIRVIKVPGATNTADLGTKALDENRIKELMAAINCVEIGKLDDMTVKPEVVNKIPRKWKKDEARAERGIESNVGAVAASVPKDLGMTLANVILEVVAAVLATHA